MILNHRHLPWALLVLIATALCSGLYVANFHPERLPYPIVLPRFFGETPPRHNTIGGTPLGVAYGSAALLIFIFAALLNIRKKKRLWKVGHVQAWLRAHIWLTILTIPLVLFHSGFRLGGAMTTLLVVLYAIVMVSGFYGLALQQFMPRMMKERLAREVVYEEIPYLRNKMVREAEKLREELNLKPVDKSPPVLAASAATPAEPDIAVVTTTAPAAVEAEAAVSAEHKLAEFLELEIVPYLQVRRGRKHRLGSQQTSDELFCLLKVNVAGKYWPKVTEMQSWCDDRRMMDLQLRLHHWLHGWLLVHVPLSFLLLILTIWHAVATLYFF